jgi:hypothetical protein
MKKNLAAAIITSMASIAAFAQVTATAPQVGANQVDVAMPQPALKQDAVIASAQNAGNAPAPGKHEQHRHHHHKKSAESSAPKQ